MGIKRDLGIVPSHLICFICVSFESTLLSYANQCQNWTFKQFTWVE